MKEFLTHLLAAAEALAPHIHQGAVPAINAGKAILKAIEAGKELAAPGEPADLQERIDRLQKAVGQHATDTAASLRKP